MKDANDLFCLIGLMKKELLFSTTFVFMSCYFLLSLFSCNLPQIKKKAVYFPENHPNSSASTLNQPKNFSFGKTPLLNWKGITFIGNQFTDHFSKNETNEYKFLLQQNNHPIRRLPDSIIIGVKKSGTRALLEFIRLHPNVRAPSFEVHYFDKNYNQGLQWYKRRMPPTLEGQITLEKTPSYFVTGSVPVRVKRMNPSIKLLVVVRNPITRAISDYTQAVSKRNHDPVRKFEHLAFINGSHKVDMNWGPVRIGLYAKHLKTWLKHFPLSQFLFISGERLIVNPAAEMTRVQDFLGLKCIINEKYFYFNATKGFPCLLKSEGHSKPRCLGKTKGRNHPHIHLNAVEKLYEFYEPHNLKFYQMTGINFGWS